MKRLVLLGAICLLAGLTGCAEKAVPAAGWIRWVCDSQAEIAWHYVDRSHSIVDLRLNQEQVTHHLEKQPAGSGEFYTDGVLAFHMNGNEGLVYWVANNDLIGRGCTVR
nr:MliC family protein [Pseudomonas duriflava]